MGRLRKNQNEIKTSKSIRLAPKTWEKIREEQKRLKHKYFVTTLEYIISKYFKN